MKRSLAWRVAVGAAAVSLALTAGSCSKIRNFIQGTAPIYKGIAGNSAVERSDVLTLPGNYSDDTLAFSRDGKHYAYVADTSGGQRVVADGKEDPEFSKISQPLFSPGGQLFYWAMKNGTISLSADGRIIATPLVAEGQIVFSKEGGHWAAFGSEEAKDGGEKKIVLYVDGTLIGRYEDISYPDFTRNGRHYAFIAKKGETMALIVDGKETALYEAPKVKTSFLVNFFTYGTNISMAMSVHYTGGGKIVALTRGPNGWTVVKAGEPLASYRQDVLGGGTMVNISFQGFETASSIHARSLTVAEDEPVAAWWERPEGKGARWRVVVNGKPADANSAPNYWGGEPPVLSRDGKHIAYAITPVPAGNDKADTYVVADGVKHGPYVTVWGIRFTDDGDHLVYAASGEGTGDHWSFYLDGKPFGKKFADAYRPVFSSNGRHVAWQASRNDMAVLSVDGQEVATVKSVVMGPVVEDSGDTLWIVLDGKKVVKLATSLK